MDIVWIGLGIGLLLVGFAGCVLPALPGPPIAYLALLALSLARDWAALTTVELVALAGVAGVATVLDFVVPAWGAKRYGASRRGVWGSVVGMIASFFIPVFGPFGIFVGAFVGAFFGELTAGKRDRDALRAAWGTFVGTLFGVVLKLAACGVIAWYFFTRL